MSFEVLVRVPSNRIVWKPVEGCIDHKEAREQDKTRLEELKKEELESANVAPEQSA